MKILVDNNIKISELNEKEYKIIKSFCSKNLSIDNPQRESNKRLGFPYYNLPSKLYWYETRGEDFILPFGCINDIYKLFPNKDMYSLCFKQTEKIEYKSNIKLFDYQQKACDMALKKKNGVIVMPARKWKDTNSITINCKSRIKNFMDFPHE